MKVLVVGGGGREHALCAKLAQSPRVETVYCAPGNAGIFAVARCVPIGVMEFDRLASFAREEGIDLTVVGPDDPLAGGIVDVFEAAGLRVFGPRKNAAILEASKAFSKDLMKKYHIPTAAYEVFDDAQAALAYLGCMDGTQPGRPGVAHAGAGDGAHASARCLTTDAAGGALPDGGAGVNAPKLPIVLKADGLALGKGVLICQTPEEARQGVKAIMQDKEFGEAGNKLVVEEFLTGREVSVLAFVDGKTVRTMTSAQDHKRIGNGDTGPNTGGMGTFSPSPFYTPEIDAYCQKYIFQPTVDAMAKEGRPFTGIIFFGLILTQEPHDAMEMQGIASPTPRGGAEAGVVVPVAAAGRGGASPASDGAARHIRILPKVLEYNARFGDPETQVVLPRLQNDLVDVLEACIDGKLDSVELGFDRRSAVCVVLASGGYPGHYEKGFPISGLDNFGEGDCYVFHAGTAFDKDGRIVTNGGRVLGVTAMGDTLQEARQNAYAATQWIDFKGKYQRDDIGRSIDDA
ncbi:MAG: phosphoribosylamine--glycine ligase [Lachnospiraceae bacterium]|jgi:phosphoribosylamine--glycine ligase|nr:phosphoribosylamine--glycine ligase [Lachnospiraceae bacterium]